MKGWHKVFLKEIREFTRDRRIFFSALFGPIIIEVLLITLMGYATFALSRTKEQKIYVVNANEGKPVLDILKQGSTFKIIELTSESEAPQLLKEKKARLVLSFPKGFYQKYEKRDAPEFVAIVDPNESASEITFRAVSAVIEKMRVDIGRARMVERHLDPKYFDPFVMKEQKADTGKPFGGAWLVGFLPYLVIIWAFYGGFSIVGDLVAGEKERGSLETLLISPLTRSGIALGKFMALALLSLVSAICAIIGVLLPAILRLPYTEGLFQHGFSMSIPTVFAILLTLFPIVIFFAGSLLAVSTYARNQREVQSYLSLLSFVVIIPALFSQFIGLTEASTSKWVSFVPILNTANVLREALLDKVNWVHVFITASVSIVLAVVGIMVAIRLFNNERVLMRV